MIVNLFAAKRMRTFIFILILNDIATIKEPMIYYHRPLDYRQLQFMCLEIFHYFLLRISC